MSGDERNDKAYRVISGRSPRTEIKPAPTTLDFHGSLGLLYGRVKSQTRLAEILGVPRRTLRRWLAGETPGRTAADRARRQLVEGAAKAIIRSDDAAALQAERRRRLPMKREAKIRAGTTIVVKAWLRYENEGDPRTITFSVGGALGLDPGAIGAAVDEFLNGATADDGPHVQNEGIAAPLFAGIGDAWYREAFADREPDALAFDVVSIQIK